MDGAWRQVISNDTTIWSIAGFASINLLACNPQRCEFGDSGVVFDLSFQAKRVQRTDLLLRILMHIAHLAQHDAASPRVSQLLEQLANRADEFNVVVDEFMDIRGYPLGVNSLRELYRRCGLVFSEKLVAGRRWDSFAQDNFRNPDLGPDLPASFRLCARLSLGNRLGSATPCWHTEREVLVRYRWVESRLSLPTWNAPVDRLRFAEAIRQACVTFCSLQSNDGFWEEMQSVGYELRRELASPSL